MKEPITIFDNKDHWTFTDKEGEMEIPKDTQIGDVSNVEEEFEEHRKGGVAEVLIDRNYLKKILSMMKGEKYVKLTILKEGTLPPLKIESKRYKSYLAVVAEEEGL